MKTVHVLSVCEVITALEMDYDSIMAKKKLLINNNDIPADEKVKALRAYNHKLLTIMLEQEQLWQTEWKDNEHVEQFHL